MSLQTVLEKIIINPNIAAPTIITNAITALYVGSDEMRAKLEEMTLPIIFTQSQGSYLADPGLRTIYFGPAPLMDTAWIDGRTGTTFVGSDTRAIAHELGHILEGTWDWQNLTPPTDFTTPNYDYVGDAVRFENQIMEELDGLSRASYTAGMTFDEMASIDKDIGESLSDGKPVDIVILDSGNVQRNIFDTSYSNKSALLVGLAEADTIVSGSGNDYLYGGDGNDTLIGGAGSDSIVGNAGNDTVFAGTYSISTNDPTQMVDTGNEIILTGEGDDVVYVGGGSDIVSLGNGDDKVVLSDGGGPTVIWGGEGDDTYEFKTGATVMFVELSGVTDEFMKNINLRALFEAYKPSEGYAGYIIINAEANDKIIMDGKTLGATTIHAEATTSEIDWEPLYTDTGATDNGMPIYAPTALVRHDVVETEREYQFTVDSSIGILLGGSSDDHNILFADDLKIFGFKDGDAGISFQGDVLEYEEADTITTKAVDLVSGAMPYQIRTENGIVYHDYHENQWQVVGPEVTSQETFGWALKPDWWDTQGHYTGDAEDFTRDPNDPYDPNDPWGPEPQPDPITGTTGDDQIEGTEGNDIIQAVAGNDVVIGQGGDDILDGGDGDDIVVGGDDQDALLGGAGNDMLMGESGNDMIDGGAGEDIALYNGTLSQFHMQRYLDGSVRVGHFLSGGDILTNVEKIGLYDFEQNYTEYDLDDLAPLRDAPLPTIFGTDADETLTGSAGEDVFYGKAGDDVLFGSSGSDHYLYDDGHGEDVIADWGDAMSTDVVILGEGVESEDMYISRGDDDFWDMKLEFDGGGSITVTAGFISSGTVIEEFRFYDDVNLTTDDVKAMYLEQEASSGNDYIHGFNESDDDIDGRGGNDELYGYSGNDTLNGNGGNDVLFGQEGDDTLLGKAGDDFMIGGEGADTFTFSSATEGTDWIDDFEAGEDKIDLSAITSIEDFADVLAIAEEWGGTTWINFNQSNSIRLQNVTLASLSAGDFVFA